VAKKSILGSNSFRKLFSIISRAGTVVFEWGKLLNRRKLFSTATENQNGIDIFWNLTFQVQMR